MPQHQVSVLVEMAAVADRLGSSQHVRRGSPRSGDGPHDLAHRVAPDRNADLLRRWEHEFVVARTFSGFVQQWRRFFMRSAGTVHSAPCGRLPQTSPPRCMIPPFCHRDVHAPWVELEARRLPARQLREIDRMLSRGDWQRAASLGSPNVWTTISGPKFVNSFSG